MGTSCEDGVSHTVKGHCDLYVDLTYMTEKMSTAEISTQHAVLKLFKNCFLFVCFLLFFFFFFFFLGGGGGFFLFFFFFFSRK